ncbi:hypothetical protein B9Z19DRAFT_1125030 [Tuber borchii]|uniref:Uncharacterized protein n=1 Tax=Tuber borchii TaxID=42251 RepID=A0A2T6ZVJ7_TUBBO|nr:hypothetical protein B9Z19DRAFT_1125030 [Tuber borchii]
MPESFDAFDLAINPEDGYRIVCFTPDLDEYGISGRFLDPRFIDHPQRAIEELLK